MDDAKSKQAKAPMLSAPELKPFQLHYVNHGEHPNRRRLVGTVEFSPTAMKGDRATFIRLKDQDTTPVIVPPGVKVQRLPFVGDMRHRVDARTFKGGEFMKDWRAKRAGADVGDE